MLQRLKGTEDAPATRSGPARVLFLCTGNSARSQIGEALLRHMGGESFAVFSAGSQPRASIHPLAREVVRKSYGIDMKGQHPKGIDDLPGPFDWIITVCDRAADSCPLPPPGGGILRWSLEDPADVPGSEEERKEAFRKTARELHRLIAEWLQLNPIAR
ncbi:MAG: arsenate reductase ArsC [Acidobacteriota bacterium]